MQGIIFIVKLTLFQIMNILGETAHLPKASYDFSQAHGILTWILQLTERRYDFYFHNFLVIFFLNKQCFLQFQLVFLST